MQFGLLLIACTLTSLELVHCARMSIQVSVPHIVHVILYFPYDIQFVFFPTDQFVPQKLSGRINSEPPFRRRPFERTTSIENNTQVIVFQNTQDLNLRHNDELVLSMDYTYKNDNRVHSTVFSYYVYEYADIINVLETMSTQYAISWESPEDQPRKEATKPQAVESETTLQPPRLKIDAETLPDAWPDVEWFEGEAPGTSKQPPLQQFQRSADSRLAFPELTKLVPPKKAEFLDQLTTLTPKDEMKRVLKDVFNKPTIESNQSKNVTKTESENRRLLLTGDALSLLINSDARRVISNIMIGDLLLPQLTPNIARAQFVADGLLFEMAAVKDVAEILTKAHRLQESGAWDYNIKETELKFFNFLAVARG